VEKKGHAQVLAKGKRKGKLELHVPCIGDRRLAERLEQDIRRTKGAADRGGKKILGPKRAVRETKAVQEYGKGGKMGR